MFKNFFQGNKTVEPVYPGESFSVGNIYSKKDNSLVSVAVINQSYKNYPNKKLFPYCIQITLQYSETNENSFPDDAEGEILNTIEDDFLKFLRKTNTVHHLGHVTNRGYRDILFYSDKLTIPHEELIAYLDKVQEIRRLNFSVEKDESWNFVSAFI